MTEPLTEGKDVDAELTIPVALGAELRRARDTLGWTRAELARRAPFGIHVQTLAGYERGTVQCSAMRFSELCQVMGVPAPDLFAWAMQRAKVDLETIGMQLDLYAIHRDSGKPELLPLRRWARHKLNADSDGSGIARVTWSAIGEMAAAFRLERAVLVDHLVSYTPRPAPLRR